MKVGLKEVTGDIWGWAEFLKAYVVIPTNGYVNFSGKCIMGKGLALQAAQRYSLLPECLGSNIWKTGNRVYVFEGLRIITFPVKKNWWEKADLQLIRKSTEELREAIYCSPEHRVLLPRVGCGNGRLEWNVVRPILEEGLRGVTNVIICHPPEEEVLEAKLDDR